MVESGIMCEEDGVAGKGLKLREYAEKRRSIGDEGGSDTMNVLNRLGNGDVRSDQPVTAFQNCPIPKLDGANFQDARLPGQEPGRLHIEHHKSGVGEGAVKPGIGGGKNCSGHPLIWQCQHEPNLEWQVLHSFMA